jgi:hypothetical protein
MLYEKKSVQAAAFAAAFLCIGPAAVKTEPEGEFGLLQ